MIRFFLVRILVPLFAILIVRSLVVAIARLFTQTFTAPASHAIMVPHTAGGNASSPRRSA